VQGSYSLPVGRTLAIPSFLRACQGARARSAEAVGVCVVCYHTLLIDYQVNVQCLCSMREPVDPRRASLALMLERWGQDAKNDHLASTSLNGSRMNELRLCNQLGRFARHDYVHQLCWFPSRQVFQLQSETQADQRGSWLRRPLAMIDTHGNRAGSGCIWRTEVHSALLSHHHAPMRSDRGFTSRPHL